MTRFSTLLLTFLAAPWLTSGQARADYLNWTYSTTTNPPVVASGEKLPTGGGAVQLTGYSSQAGGLSIPVIGYDTLTSVPINFDSHYSMTMTITDGTTHHSGMLTFNAAIKGDLTPTASSLVNTFDSPQSLTLDGHIYTVSIPRTNLAAPPSPQQDILASIHVSQATGHEGDGGTDVRGVPEPDSLMLTGLGLSSVGVRYCWNRMRRFVRQSV